MKKKVYYRNVLLPIEVPYGKFCWGKGRFCMHLDSKGGFAECNLRIGDLIIDKNGDCLKPPECRSLKNV